MVFCSIRPFRGLMVLLALWAGSASAQPNLPAESPWRREVSYEVFVRAFADSDGDGIGDLRGLTQKLDYLADLGVGNLWLMPIHPAPTYHKYDVVDYKAVAPEYGTLEDLRELVRQAHQRGIRITLDLVFNHVSDRHPWFVSASTDPNSPYRDYFVWRHLDRPEALATDTIRNEWTRNEALNREYYHVFWTRMPDLNLDHPEVRKELISVGEYWVKEAGVDGYRLDAARHAYNRSPEGQAKGVAFWREWRDAVARTKPDLYTVGEIWTDTKEIAPWFAAFDANFNFPLGYQLIQTVAKGHDTVGTAGVVTTLLRQRAAYAQVNPAFIDATFLTNHDQARFTKQLPRQEEQKLAAALLLTLPGAPYLYYGEEIGMIGPKPDERIREPFAWSATSPENTHWRPSAILGGSLEVIPLDRQQANPNSLYQHYRTWIRLRNATPALHSGGLEAVNFGTDQVIAFWRVAGNQQVLVVHNLHDQPLSLSWPRDVPRRYSILAGAPTMSAKGLSLPARGSAVLQVR